MIRPKKQHTPFADLFSVLSDRMQPPFGVALGSPGEAMRIVEALGSADVVCYQMDLHMAERLRDALAENNLTARIETAPDLWDLPPTLQTLIYSPPRGGERELKIDVVEQAFHVLRPGGLLVIPTTHRKDAFFPPLLKKIFGKVHAPTAGRNVVLWAQRDGDRPRRRHEMTFHVRQPDAPSLVFTSRPGTFSYGHFDDGARVLMAESEVRPGDRVVDIGCGCGTIGTLAARRGAGYVAFVDSNTRALALADLNARGNGVTAFETFASARVEGPAEGTFDVALANPPYMDRAAVAGLFALRAFALLKPGGRLHMVTKQIHEVLDILGGVFGTTEGIERGSYVVFTAVKRQGRSPGRSLS